MNLLLALSLIAFAINLPCGIYRATTKRLSLKWVMAIHIPIPFIIFLRMKMGLGYSIIPFVIIASFLGQYLGGKIRVE